MIFYFTGTGNSLWVAGQMQKELGGELCSIADMKMDYKLAPNEILGFVFPVYYWAMPDIVKSFIEHLNIRGSRASRTFIAVTCGGITGSTCEKTEELLQSRDIFTGYKTALHMVDNYAPLYQMPDQETAKTKLEIAHAPLNAFISIIKEGRMGDYNNSKGFMPSLTSPIMNLAFPRKTRKFKASETCISCGLCSSICPAQAIEMEKGIPVWKKKTCEKCLACLHRCPAQAINYGMLSEKHGRYLNPEINF